MRISHFLITSWYSYSHHSMSSLYVIIDGEFKHKEIKSHVQQTNVWHCSEPCHPHQSPQVHSARCLCSSRKFTFDLFSLQWQFQIISGRWTGKFRCSHVWQHSPAHTPAPSLAELGLQAWAQWIVNHTMMSKGMRPSQQRWWRARGQHMFHNIRTNPVATEP